jgi:lactonase
MSDDWLPHTACHGKQVGPVPQVECSPTKVSDRHEDSPLGPLFQSILEGPVFGPDGDLYLPDVAAPAGEPKVVKIDMESKEITTVHTDETSIYSSAQFSPADGMLYLADFGGRIERMNPDGSEVETVLEGLVEDQPMAADDIAFDADGNMYLTDFVGTPWDPTGRLIRLNADGTSPTVIQGRLTRPNGIAFTPDHSRLWVNEATADHVANFSLSEDGTTVVDSFIGMRIDNGLVATRPGVVRALDSITLDAEGNIYQAVHGAGEILVWDQAGQRVATVKLDEVDVTNVAIKPGTREAYATTAGEDGGYVYQFEALAEALE